MWKIVDKIGAFGILFLGLIFGFMFGYVVDARHKANRIWDMSKPVIEYRDTCFYQFNPIKNN